MMKIVNLQQGSQPWLDFRALHNTASEAPAMMGTSEKVRRDELLHAKVTKDENEIPDYVREVIFPKGHEVEKLARPFAEKIIGEDLFPITGVDDDDYLAASFDGLNMLQTIAWECKQWNEGKAELVRQGIIPDEDLWQVVQLLIVSGAEKCLYMVTDGTEDKMVSTWYDAKADDFGPQGYALLGGWAQFDQDRETFIPTVKQKPPEAAPVKALPAIIYQLNGLAITSNLGEYKEAAKYLVEQSKVPMNTDQEFADADARVKAFKKAEENIALICDQAIGEVQDIDKFRKDLMEVSGLLRQARLNGEKLVDKRKLEIRSNFVTTGQDFIDQHIAELNGQFNRPYIQEYKPDFWTAIKGKRTLDSIGGAVNDLVASSKIALSDMAARAHANTKTLNDLATDYKSLFVDLPQIIFKDSDDFRNLVEARISDHQRETVRRDEEKRLADEQSQAVQNNAPETSSPAVEQNLTPRSPARTIQPTNKNQDVMRKRSEGIIKASLLANGVGVKTAVKVAKLISDGKLDGVLVDLNMAVAS